MIDTHDFRLSAELFAICVETNCQVEGMKAENVKFRTRGGGDAPYDESHFNHVLARHEARIDQVKREAAFRAARPRPPVTDPGEICPRDYDPGTPP